MATRLIDIPQLNVGSKKYIKTNETIMTSDYVEIKITLYENGQPKSFSPNTKFEAYGKFYKSNQSIEPIFNSQFTIIDSEKVITLHNIS